jgi:hypothetical protein
VQARLDALAKAQQQSRVDPEQAMANLRSELARQEAALTMQDLAELRDALGEMRGDFQRLQQDQEQLFDFTPTVPELLVEDLQKKQQALDLRTDEALAEARDALLAAGDRETAGELVVPEDLTGAVMSDLSGRRGRILGTDGAGPGRTRVDAHVPESELTHFAAEFRALTSGRGALDMRYSHHEEVPDNIAKRLLDFGVHPPTTYFPLIVPEALMIEPTESEPLAELDRFCDAMFAIADEIDAIESGAVPHEDSALAHAPHTAEDLLVTDWDRPYSREDAAYPLPSLRRGKYWPPVSRIDGAAGARNLVCACPPPEAFEA